jgi:hypothetical protein
MIKVETRHEKQVDMAYVKMPHCYTYTTVDFSNCGRAHLHYINMGPGADSTLREMEVEDRRDLIYGEVFEYLTNDLIYYGSPDSDKKVYDSRRWLITMSDSVKVTWYKDLPKSISVFGFAMWCMKNHPEHIQAMPVSHRNHNSSNYIGEFTFMPNPSNSRPLKDVVEEVGGTWHGDK